MPSSAQCGSKHRMAKLTVSAVTPPIQTPVVCAGRKRTGCTTYIQPTVTATGGSITTTLGEQTITYSPTPTAVVGAPVVVGAGSTCGACDLRAPTVSSCNARPDSASCLCSVYSAKLACVAALRPL